MGTLFFTYAFVGLLSFLLYIMFSLLLLGEYCLLCSDCWWRFGGGEIDGGDTEYFRDWELVRDGSIE